MRTTVVVLVALAFTACSKGAAQTVGKALAYGTLAAAGTAVGFQASRPSTGSTAGETTAGPLTQEELDAPLPPSTGSVNPLPKPEPPAPKSNAPEDQCPVLPPAPPEGTKCVDVASRRHDDKPKCTYYCLNHCEFHPIR